MRLPFGLDLKTIIVTILFMMFVLPFVTSLFAKRSGGTKEA